MAKTRLQIVFHCAVTRCSVVVWQYCQEVGWLGSNGKTLLVNLGQECERECCCPAHPERCPLEQN